MKFLLLAAIVGAIAAPAAVSADVQPFKLTLAPAIALVAPDQQRAEFLLINSASQSVHIVVSASDAWVVPAEKSFDIAPRERHTVPAEIARHPEFDAGGDHETDLAFSTPPNGDGIVRVSYAITARVIIDSGGRAFRDLKVFGLSAPTIADSFDSPNVTITLDNSRSNVHQVVEIPPFPDALLLRGQVRTVTTRWTDHPWIGFGVVGVGKEEARTLFLPWRLGLGLLALLCGLGLLRASRQDRVRPNG